MILERYVPNWKTALVFPFRMLVTIEAGARFFKKVSNTYVTLKEKQARESLQT
jgi:hypothetical protein